MASTAPEPKLDPPGRGRIYDGIVETIGGTRRWCASSGFAKRRTSPQTSC